MAAVLRIAPPGRHRQPGERHYLGRRSTLAALGAPPDFKEVDLLSGGLLWMVNKASTCDQRRTRSIAHQPEAWWGAKVKKRSKL